MDRPILDFAEARNRMVDSQIRPNKVMSRQEYAENLYAGRADNR